MLSKLAFLLPILLNSCIDSKFESTTVDFTKTENYSINQNDTNCLRIVIAAMISPKETYNLYNDLFNYVSKEANIPIKIYQRKTYSETNELISQNSVDIGFVCTGAYLKNRNNCKLVAVPVFNDLPYYQAYIIVNKKVQAKKFEELKGHTFAFTDPLSNTGKIYPEKKIKQLFHLSPETFFKSITYTGSHDASIRLVSKGIIDAASVDGLIYEYYLHNAPDEVTNIEIIEKSEYFGAPPIVCSNGLNEEVKLKIQKIILEMHNNAQGKIILNKLMIDRFTFPDDTIYRSAVLNCEE